MSLKETLKMTEDKMKKAIDSVSHDFAEVSTGRANPSLIEDLKVDYYGAPTPIKQIAGVSVLDAKTIAIQPWDKSALECIEKGIMSSNIGITPSNDGHVVRLAVPALSEERRKELAKVAKDMAEKGRVSIRNIRREGNEKAKSLQNDKVLNEDECFKLQEDIQKLTDKYIKEVDAHLDKKTKDLMAI